MCRPASNRTKYPFSEFFLLFTPWKHRKIKRSANLSYSFPSRNSGQGFVSGFDRCTSRWWGTLPESSRFPGLHVQKNFFSRIMWFSEGRNTEFPSHTRTSRSFLERTRVVWKHLSSEKSWLGTISHSAQPDPHKTQICSLTAPSGKVSPWLHGYNWQLNRDHLVVYIGCDILVQFGLCQNALCKITHPGNYALSARVSARPTERGWASLMSASACWTPILRQQCEMELGAGDWHKKALFWSNGAEVRRISFVFYPTPASMFLAAISSGSLFLLEGSPLLPCWELSASPHCFAQGIYPSYI